MKLLQRAHLITKLWPCQRAISFPQWHRTSTPDPSGVRDSLMVPPCSRTVCLVDHIEKNRILSTSDMAHECSRTCPRFDMARKYLEINKKTCALPSSRLGADSEWILLERLPTAVKQRYLNL